MTNPLVLLPTIICGDCLEYLPQLGEGIADLALIDAPYFNYVTGHRKDKEDKLSQPLVQQSREDQLRTVQECIRVLKDGKSFWFFTNWQEAWWFQQRFHSFLRNEIIWEKNNWTAGDLEGSLANKYEVIFLGTKGKGWKYSGSRIHDIWQVDRVGTNRIHATEKPIDLYKKIIELVTQEGDFIIDPYCGSGASAIAALELKRNFLGYEIDDTYYSRIMTRIKEHKIE